MTIKKTNKNGDTVSIFKTKKAIDKYEDNKPVLNTVRTDKETALKIIELQEVCKAETGDRNFSKNKLLVGIVTSFINDIETIATTNEELATQKLLAVINA